jgi:hypothetical protein
MRNGEAGPSVEKIKILVNLEVDHKTYRPLKLLVEEESFCSALLAGEVNGRLFLLQRL